MNQAPDNMGMTVVLAREAQEEFLKLPRLVQARMNGIFERLKRWPDVSGAKPLRGKLAGQYRMRTGDYRVQFRAEKERLVIVKVGHRDGFYDE